jgi:hypothetical protein
MKKLVISEGELKKLIRTSIGKNLQEQGFTVEPHIPETPREMGIKDVFGRYSSEIPNDILRYMRKNPKLIIQRLMDLYGDKFFEYVGTVMSDTRKEQGPLDEQFNFRNEPDDDDEEEDESYEDYQMRSYMDSVAKPINDGDDFDDSMETEIEFYRGPMRPFRASIYIDGSVPETNNKELDRKVAKKMVEFLAKRLKYENYVGGVGFKQRGNLSQPYDSDF